MATKMTREEAIKIVQSATVWTDEERDALAMLIPELAESEDERIIRFFAELATDACGGPGQEYYEELGLNYDKVMAWLEKQKEQKPGEIPPYVTGIKGEPDPAGVWKPSEEQMNALNALNCHGDLSYVGQQNQLVSLYQDLKKLM